HHLDVVPGPAAADPFAAGDVGLRPNLRADGPHDVFHVRPRGSGAARHEARPVAGAFFAAGDARAEIQEARGFGVFGASVGVGVIGVAAVDENVSLAEQRLEFGDELVDSGTSLDHHHDPPRRFEATDQFLQRVTAGQLFAGIAFEEIVHLADRAVEHGDMKAVVFHVEDEILTHDGEPDETNVTLRHGSVP